MTKTIWNLPKVKQMPFSELEERRRVLLVTSAPAWKAVKDRLRLTVAVRLEPDSANLADWQRLLGALDAYMFEKIYAVGGGLAADAAKYLAAQLDMPLVMMPTALSVDAFLTAASGIRKDGCVYYIETKPPEELILDLDVIAEAPLSVRSAGITDVLSIATGCWDWQFAERRGMNPPGMEFIPWVYANAQSILEGALDCAAAAGAGDREGLKTLYDCLAMEVQLCNQVGHARPEEGSEHYFAYSVENVIGHGLPHGDLVGPGILIAAGWQGQDTRRLEAALRACHVPAAMPLDRIPAEVVESTRRGLAAYCRQHNLAYGIAHEQL
jgi:glycerol-1-phosphate dehydrogenase [NAD(P)+]